MLINSLLTQHIHNHRHVITHRDLYERFYGFNPKQASHEHLKNIRTLLRQGAEGVRNKIISLPSSEEGLDSDVTNFLSAAEKAILAILMSSFTLKHATDYIADIKASGGKMLSLHQREARGETVQNRRTGSDPIRHYYIYFTLGIGDHPVPQSIVTASDIVTVDLQGMMSTDPLTLARVSVNDHISEYKHATTHRIRIGNARYLISYFPDDTKKYDITYDNGTHLQWERAYHSGYLCGADIAPGIALEFLYILRLLGGSNNSSVQQLYSLAHDKESCFPLLQQMMSVLMPGYLYPEAAVVGELNLSANYVSIAKNNVINNSLKQIELQAKILSYLIKQDNLTSLRALLKKGYFQDIGFYLSRVIYTLCEKENLREILAVLIQFGITFLDDNVLFALAKRITATDFDYLLSQEYSVSVDPKIKRIPNPNPNAGGGDSEHDLVHYLCRWRNTGLTEWLKVLNQHGANFQTRRSVYLKSAKENNNHRMLEFLGEQRELNKPQLELKTRHLSQRQKVVAIILGIRPDNKPYTLLGRPRSSASNTKDYYCFPGGSVDPTKDKDLLTAAIRELFEETSIDVSQIDSVNAQMIPTFKLKMMNNDDLDSTTFFVFNIGKVPIKPHPCDDLVALRSVSLDQLNIDRGDPAQLKMTLGDKPILGSNALLIEALLLRGLNTITEEQNDAIHTLLKREADPGRILNYSNPISVEHTEILRKTVCMALAHKQYNSPNFFSTFSLSLRSMDLNFDLYQELLQNPWPDVTIIISFLRRYIHLEQNLQEKYSLKIDDFYLALDQQSKPTIQFISKSRSVLERLINKIDPKCYIHQKEDRFYIQCGPIRLGKLGLPQTYIDFILTFGVNSPTDAPLPQGSEKPLIENQEPLISPTEISSPCLDNTSQQRDSLAVYNNKVYQRLLTLVQQELSAMNSLELNGPMSSLDIIQFCSLTAHQNEITTISIDGSILRELQATDAELALAHWIASFTKLDKIIMTGLSSEQLIAWIALLAKTTAHQFLTLQITDKSYFANKLRHIEATIRQHGFHHEICFVTASESEQKRINEAVLFCQKQLKLDFSHQFKSWNYSQSLTTEQYVKRKLYYQWYYQSSSTELIVDYIIDELSTILKNCVTLKSISFETHFSLNKKALDSAQILSVLHALVDTSSRLEHLDLAHVSLNEVMINYLVKLLKKHPLKQLVISDHPVLGKKNGENLARALANHPCLEVFICKELPASEMGYFKYINLVRRSMSLLFIDYDPEAIHNVTKIKTMSKKQSTGAVCKINDQISVKNLTAVSLFKSEPLKLIEDITAEEMSLSAFGQGSKTAQRLKARASKF